MHAAVGRDPCSSRSSSAFLRPCVVVSVRRPRCQADACLWQPEHNVERILMERTRLRTHSNSTRRALPPERLRQRSVLNPPLAPLSRVPAYVLWLQVYQAAACCKSPQLLTIMITVMPRVITVMTQLRQLQRLVRFDLPSSPPSACSLQQCYSSPKCATFTSFRGSNRIPPACL